MENGLQERWAGVQLGVLCKKTETVRLGGPGWQWWRSDKGYNYTYGIVVLAGFANGWGAGLIQTEKCFTEGSVTVGSPRAWGPPAPCV